MLPPGSAYVGGDQFFDTDEPEDNTALISLVDRNAGPPASLDIDGCDTI
jgi:hypothetical protein